MSMGIIYRWHHAPEFFFNQNLGIILRTSISLSAVAPFLIAIRWVVVGHPKSKYALYFFLAGIFLSRLAFSLLIDNELISDYSTMWKYAVSIVSTGIFKPADSIPELRTIPFFLPAAYFSNGASWGYEFLNSLAITAIAFLLFQIAKHISNMRVAYIALLLFACAPEPLFAVETVTHDIPGTLYAFLVIFVAIHFFYRQQPKLATVLILSIGCGLFLSLLELQRNIAFILFLAIIQVTIAQYFLTIHDDREITRNGYTNVIHPRLAYILIFLCVLVLSYGGLGLVSKELVYSKELPDRIAEWKTSWATFHAHSQSVGSYYDYEKMMPYLELLTPDEKGSFTKARSLSDIYHNILDWPQMYARKMMRLYSLGRQGDEYFGHPARQTKIFNEDYAVFSASLHLYTLVYSLALMSFAIIAFTYLLFWKFLWPVALLPAVFLGLLTLALGVAGEIQSRYVFPAWAILSLYIGFLEDTPRWTRSKFLVNNLWSILLITALSVIIFGIGYGVFRHQFSLVDGRIIERGEWSYSGEVSFSEPFKTLLSHNAEKESWISFESSVFPYHSYEWTFFSVFEEGQDSNCRLSISLEIGSFRQNVLITAAANKPILWRVKFKSQSDNAVSFKIKLLPSSHGDETPACRSMTVDYSRIIQYGDAHSYENADLVDIEGPANIQQL